MSATPEPVSVELRELLAKASDGPWELCQHLKGIEEDAACPCGYRGVVYGPGFQGYAVFQPGHERPPVGQEGSEPPRYPRETEIANSQLIVALRNNAEHLLDTLAADRKRIGELEAESACHRQAGIAEGLERARQVAEEHAETSRQMHNASAKDRDTEGCLVHGEAWRVGREIAHAIRTLSDEGAAS